MYHSCIMIIFKISPRNTDVSHSITVVSELYYAHRSEYILYQSVSECIIIIGANTIVIHVLIHVSSRGCPWCTLIQRDNVSCWDTQLWYTVIHVSRNGSVIHLWYTRNTCIMRDEWSHLDTLVSHMLIRMWYTFRTRITRVLLNSLTPRDGAELILSNTRLIHCIIESKYRHT